MNRHSSPSKEDKIYNVIFLFGNAMKHEVKIQETLASQALVGKKCPNCEHSLVIRENEAHEERVICINCHAQALLGTAKLIVEIVSPR